MKKILIITILVIFIIGGSYAVYLGNGLLNKDSKDISPDSGVSVDNTTADNQKTDITSDINGNPNNDNAKYDTHYRTIPGTMVQVNTSVDYTDLYAQCVVCGGFVPLGEVTKALPEDALCPDLCGGSSTINGYDYVYTYDIAYEFWLEYGSKYGRQPQLDIPVDTTPSNSEPIIQPTDTVDSDYEPGEIVVNPDMNIF